jgi:acyl-CoA dehydrogenase
MSRDLFELSPEQREIQTLCRDFAEREIRPIAHEVDETDTEMPWRIWYEAAAVGLTSFMLPERLGGGGMEDSFTQVLVQEELCWGCSAIGNVITSNGFFAKPCSSGHREQARRWIEPLIGERPRSARSRAPSPGSAPTLPR